MNEIEKYIKNIDTGDPEIDRFVEKWAAKVAEDEKLQSLIQELVDHVKENYKNFIPEFYEVVQKTVMKMLLSPELFSDNRSKLDRLLSLMPDPNFKGRA